MADGNLAAQTPAATYAELLRLVNGKAQLGDGTAPESIGIDDIRTAGNPVYDVTHPTFGAVGDGSADDTAAIQAAIAAAEAVTDSGGGTIYLPAGTYRLEGELVITKPNITLRGARHSATRVDYYGDGTAITVTAEQKVTIEDMWLRNLGEAGLVGISLEYAGPTTGYQFAIRRVGASGFVTSGYGFHNIEQSEFADLLAWECGIGYQIDNAAHQNGSNGISNIYLRCRAQDCDTDGWDIANQSASEFIGCQAFGAGNIQFRVRGSCRGLKISRLDIEHASELATIGLQLSGIEHIVDVAAYSLTTAIFLTAASQCLILPSQFSTVTTAIHINSGDDNVVIAPGRDVTDGGTRTTVITSGARAMKIAADWIRVQSGSGGGPAIAAAADFDTGIWWPGGDELGFSGGGVQRMRIMATELRLYVAALRIGGATNPIIIAGTGAPEGTVTAPPSSLYVRVDGAAGTTLYVKESGTGNTGWSPLETIAGAASAAAGLVGAHALLTGDGGHIDQQAAIEDLDMTVSDPPEDDEVQDIADKVDAILAALRAGGIIATT